MVENAGTFLLWYDTNERSALTRVLLLGYPIVSLEVLRLPA